MSTFIYLDGRLAGHPDTTVTRAGHLVFRSQPTVRMELDQDGSLVYTVRNETASPESRIPPVLAPYVKQIRMFREIPNRHGLAPGFYHHGKSEAVLENDDGDPDWLGVVIQGTDMGEMEALFLKLLEGTMRPTPTREVRRRQTSSGSSLFSNPPPPASIRTGPLGKQNDLSVRFLPPNRIKKPETK